MILNEIKIAPPNWGISFDRPAVYAGGLPLRVMPPPEQLIVPLQQSKGRAAQAIVAAGQQVLRGQPIGCIPTDTLSANVHAPTSGTVSKIAPHSIPGGGASLCVFITADGLDQPWDGYQPIAEPLQTEPAELLAAATAAGIVGLGGAMFPTDRKLQPDNPVTTLILNGVECEPRINCDDALLSHNADEMLLGAQLMLRILGAKECVVALKADALVALDVVRTAVARLNDKRFRMALAPPVYPAGGETQLIQLLTEREVPAGGLPKDIGIICQNVATAAALAKFVSTGEPLISRIVTVTGSGIKQPQNVVTRLGTPIQELIEFAGGYTTNTAQINMGGPMMGVPLDDDSVPVTKASNCILVESTAQLNQQAAATERPCIRCGDCAIVCPVTLTPQILWQAERSHDYERLEQLGLSECIECGCCDYVCPSHIPLTSLFTAAKKQLADITLDKQRAHKAELRFAARGQRLKQEEQIRQQELDAQLHSADMQGDAAKATLQRLLDRANPDENRDE
jgi:electron transport complex protein RnfC